MARSKRDEEWDYLAEQVRSFASQGARMRVRWEGCWPSGEATTAISG